MLLGVRSSTYVLTYIKLITYIDIKQKFVNKNYANSKEQEEEVLIKKLF